MKNSALVVIDLQNDITKHYREIIDPSQCGNDSGRPKGLWVIYHSTNNLSAGTRTFKPGTRGAELSVGAERSFRVISLRSSKAMH
ncbi:MAG: hypothetical protein ACLU3I_21185 [Acutalibacteraceae bacterium]